MKLKKADEALFCRYVHPQPPERRGERFDQLSTDEERRTLSLADEGIGWITGLGFSRYRRPHPSLDLHVHPGTVEIHCCLTGYLQFEIDGRTVDVLPGEVCLTQPRCRHRLVTNAKGHSHYWLLVKLPTTDAEAAAPGLPLAEARGLIRQLKGIRRNVFAVGDDVPRLFRALFADLDAVTPPQIRRLFLRADVIRLLLAIIRDARRTVLTAMPEAAKAAVEGIRRSPTGTPSLADLKQATGLNRNLLTRCFKRLTGLPPKAFASSIRMAKAKELLAESAIPITVISDQLGFSSPAHFSSQFKLHVGVSPRAYRMAPR